MMAWLDTVHPERIDQMDRDPSTGKGRREFTQKELIDLWDARCALESVAIRLACDHVEESDLRELRAIAAARAEAAVKNDEKTALVHDLEFHRLIVRLSNNPILVDLIASFPLFDDEILAEDSPANVHHVLDIQSRMIEALVDHQADLAEKLMRSLIDHDKQRSLDALSHRFQT